jgi:cytochrome c biogenesis protein CcmG, thiol:disulfide interchange protein DsbE
LEDAVRGRSLDTVFCHAGLIVALAALVVASPAGAAESLKAWKGGATPALVLKTPAGETVDLAKLGGKVVLVNFWATWCAPCVEEMPALARLRDRLADRGLEVIAVNEGEMPERVTGFANRTGLDLSIVLDRDKQAAKAWKVRALPTTYIVDRRGRIRLFAEGELDTGAALEAAITPLLPGERPSSAAR